MRLLAEEATRPQVSLAREYFVGSRRFINRMIDKFGLEVGRFIKRKKLDSGLECVGPELGRVTRMV
jgi:hypothetical protein